MLNQMSFVNYDGEQSYFIDSKGFAWAKHEDIGLYPIAKMEYNYSRARGRNDQMTAFELYTSFESTRHYAELNDVALFPNQVKAWALHLQSEC